MGFLRKKTRSGLRLEPWCSTASPAKRSDSSMSILPRTVLPESVLFDLKDILPREFEESPPSGSEISE